MIKQNPDIDLKPIPYGVERFDPCDSWSWMQFYSQIGEPGAIRDIYEKVFKPYLEYATMPKYRNAGHYQPEIAAMPEEHRLWGIVDFPDREDYESDFTLQSYCERFGNPQTDKDWKRYERHITKHLQKDAEFYEVLSNVCGIRTRSELYTDPDFHVGQHQADTNLAKGLPLYTEAALNVLEIMAKHAGQQNRAAFVRFLFSGIESLESHSEYHYKAVPTRQANELEAIFQGLNDAGHARLLEYARYLYSDKQYNIELWEQEQDRLIAEYNEEIELSDEDLGYLDSE